MTNNEIENSPGSTKTSWMSQMMSSLGSQCNRDSM